MEIWMLNCMLTKNPLGHSWLLLTFAQMILLPSNDQLNLFQPKLMFNILIIDAHKHVEKHEIKSFPKIKDFLIKLKILILALCVRRWRPSFKTLILMDMLRNSLNKDASCDDDKMILQKFGSYNPQILHLVKTLISRYA